jgi:hypothetical protein
MSYRLGLFLRRWISTTTVLTVAVVLAATGCTAQHPGRPSAESIQVTVNPLRATSYPAHAALSARAAIGSNTPVPAAPSNLTAQAVGTTSVELAWTNNASNQSGVVISLDGEESVDIQGATVSSYTWNGLSPNTQYWFYVASKIYGTPGDPTGFGNTQSAWVGPVYATTVGTLPSTSPAPQPSTSPAPPLPSTSPAPQPSTSPAPQPSTPGSGVPTTLPSQPSPTFVCVTGPGGSCLQPGAGVPQPGSWSSLPAAWVTSPLTGGCVLDVLDLLGDIGIAVIPGAGEFEGYLLAWDVVQELGSIVQFDSTGNWFVKLTAFMPFTDCVELANYVLKDRPVPQNLDFLRSPDVPQTADLLDSADLPARGPSTPKLFQPVPKSHLASLTKLPFLRQRFGYAVAQVGSVAALSQKYPAAWNRGTQKSVLCQLRRSGYRCNWRFQLKGTSHSGYVLIAVTGNSYRLEKVVELLQAAPTTTTTTSALKPLWYVLTAVALVALVIVTATFARRRRRRASAG